MTRKPKKVEFHFDERSLEAPDDDICDGDGIAGEGKYEPQKMNVPNAFPPEFIDLIRVEIDTSESPTYVDALALLAALNEIEALRKALAKSDPIHRVYDGTLPVLECIHCGGRRGRFENEVQHADSCVWKLAREKK